MEVKWFPEETPPDKPGVYWCKDDFGYVQMRFYATEGAGTWCKVLTDDALESVTQWTVCYSWLSFLGSSYAE